VLIGSDKAGPTPTTVARDIEPEAGRMEQ